MTIQPTHVSNIRKNRQEWALFSAPLLLLVLVFAVNAWRQRSRTTIETNIAFFPNTDLRESTGIREISKQIGNYPNASIYSVYMPGNGLYAAGLLIYDRPKHRLTRKDVQPMGNGMTSWWEQVSDNKLRKAAIKSASFNDMRNYGCKPMFE